jgi:hypothetical protein
MHMYHISLSPLSQMDIEFGEWAVLKQMLSSGSLDNVDQFLFEVHFWTSRSDLSMVSSFQEWNELLLGSFLLLCSATSYSYSSSPSELIIFTSSPPSPFLLPFRLLFFSFLILFLFLSHIFLFVLHFSFSSFLFIPSFFLFLSSYSFPSSSLFLLLCSSSPLRHSFFAPPSFHYSQSFTDKVSDSSLTISTQCQLPNGCQLMEITLER